MIESFGYSRPEKSVEIVTERKTTYMNFSLRGRVIALVYESTVKWMASSALYWNPAERRKLTLMGYITGSS